MADNGSKNRDTALVLALAGGSSIRSAARKTGLSERTIHRRLTDPDFRRLITEARAAIIERSAARMTRNTTAAADTLRRLLNAPSDSVKLGAARAILELGVKLRESVELEQRISALEARYEKGNRRGNAA